VTLPAGEVAKHPGVVEWGLRPPRGITGRRPLAKQLADRRQLGRDGGGMSEQNRKGLLVVDKQVSPIRMGVDMATAMRGTSSNYLQRGPSPSGLAEVLDLILDKGLVIDAYVRVSVIGIEILTIDARIVIASVDTYLRFAEAVNRLDLTQTETAGLQELRSSGSKERTKGALEGAREKLAPGGDKEREKSRK
jgi:hypothetical protein